MTGVDHGTYAGYQKHGRDGTATCAACREAARAYMKLYRSTRPSVAVEQGRMTKVRSRALWRLADLHPAQFRALVDEEDRRDRQQKAAL